MTHALHEIFVAGQLKKNRKFVGKNLQPCKRCLQMFWAEIADIFDQKNSSHCLETLVTGLLKNKMVSQRLYSRL